MICMLLARLTKRTATCSASAASSWRLTQNAEHGDAVAADFGVKSVSRSMDFVDPAVIVSGVGAIAMPAVGGFVMWRLSYFRHSGAMRSIEPESRDSGSGPSDHPGMTVSVKTFLRPS
jgi:hypothetical protein